MWYIWSACLPGQRHLRGTPLATNNLAGQRATWDVGLRLHTFSQLHTDIFDDQMSPNTLPLHNSQTLKVQFTTVTPKRYQDSLGVYLQDIVNDLHHELDTIHTTVGTTLSEPKQGALTAVPLASQLV